MQWVARWCLINWQCLYLIMYSSFVAIFIFLYFIYYITTYAQCKELTLISFLQLSNISRKISNVNYYRHVCRHKVSMVSVLVLNLFLTFPDWQSRAWRRRWLAHEWSLTWVQHRTQLKLLYLSDVINIFEQ